MGGGAAMRTAAKVAGIGVVNSGFRGAVSGLQPAEHSVRNASRPVSAVISSSSSTSSGTGVVQRPVWELDEWELAGGEEEELMLLESAEPKPRLVFGPPPTHQEAKEATSELKEALEKISLENPTHGASIASVGFGERLGLPVLTTSELTGSKNCIASAAPVPENAMRAFKLLNESPAAQLESFVPGNPSLIVSVGAVAMLSQFVLSVVASIAADPNVWHAVMNNDALTEFLQSHKPITSAINEETAESVADSSSEGIGSPKLSEAFEDAWESQKSKTGFMDILEDIKVSVVDMFGTVTSFLQNMFGESSAGAVYETEAAGSNGKSTFRENTLGASFMALAVMAIMMVCLPKEVGGLGLRRARQLNRAFLTKLAFTFFKEKDKLWVRVMQHKYFKHDGDVLTSRNLKSTSPLWRGMSHEVGTMFAGAKSAIRDGTETLFWTNNWVDSNMRLLDYAITSDPCFDIDSTVASLVDSSGQ
ncbi:Putative ribonuclease H protein At1g65750 [Linum perenne]